MKILFYKNIPYWYLDISVTNRFTPNGRVYLEQKMTRGRSKYRMKLIPYDERGDGI